MTKYQFAGPPRFVHQRAGLAGMIASGGSAALLFDAGTGKTAVALDYSGLLALKSPVGEVKILVACPLAALDTWVLQAQIFLTPQVHYWVEALGGSITQRAEALAARGGNWWKRRLPKDLKCAPRALHYQHSSALSFRASEHRLRPMEASEGPGGLATYPMGSNHNPHWPLVADKPSVIMEIVNISTFASRMQMGSKTMADFVLEAVKRFDPDLVVVDESHRIKSNGGNASNLMARIAKVVPRRTILTGTVMPHSPLDVHGQWRFLDYGAFYTLDKHGNRQPMTFDEFKDHFVRFGGFDGLEIKGYQNLDEMQEIMAQRSVVARKEDVLDLPPTTDVIVPVDLSSSEQQAYADMKRTLRAQLAAGVLAKAPNKLAQMMRLRQITSGHLPDKTGTVHVIGRSKAQVIDSIVHDNLAGEKRIVVFCLFTEEIEILRVMLPRKDTTVLTISGKTPMKDRVEMRQRFGSKSSERLVMLAQVRTMSLAINELVTANHAVFGSLSQLRDDIEQAKARLDRQGQTRPVTFWWVLAPGTVDEVIYRSYQDRSDLETAMLQHIRGEVEDDDSGRSSTDLG